MMTTDVPRSRTRRTSSSTARDCATPSAAVGSSMIISLDAQTMARAIATLWRWPPESESTGVPEMLRDADVQLVEMLLGLLAHAPTRERPRGSRDCTGTVLSRPRKRLVVDVEVRQQREILVDRLDARARGRRSGRGELRGARRR